ncbi:elongation factor P [Fluviicola taffensis]|uniref:Elongation factor P n=1 Tax=Fluviicola taffensis (strain DSM 16823 / NCIMB 13979 / RW262) TaxID=755732 RepID=F2IE44_FLUTR|nr:elongation factor P [Fluviicola taffensis]AEA45608.1 translation elongation factor P (EF-P) [Fluviicola taffensis DSM 16823]
MATTADIRNGLCIKFNDKISQIIEFQHVKPGKGPAFVRTKMRIIETGKVIDNTFSAGHKIEIVRVENREYQYLYQEDDNFIFMNNENFEQVPIPTKMVERPAFLLEGMICSILYDANDEIPLVVELPMYVISEVTYTEPGVKGDTATNSMKPATIATGAEVKVPLFIDMGEIIKVDTRTGVYVERVKN